MTRRIIDISMPIENEALSDLRQYSPKLTCFNHHRSCEQMARFFPGIDREERIRGWHGGGSSVHRPSRILGLPWRSPHRGSE